MKQTELYNFNMPEREDYVLIDDLNKNTNKTDVLIGKLDTAIQTKAPIHEPRFSGLVLVPKVGTENGDEKYEQAITASYVHEVLEVENLDR